jgi:hypothetical protein
MKVELKFGIKIHSIKCMYLQYIILIITRKEDARYEKLKLKTKISSAVICVKHEGCDHIHKQCSGKPFLEPLLYSKQQT